MNLPNKLTILRLVLIIPLLGLFIGYKYLSNNYYDIAGRSVLASALFIFIFAMITDFLDGKIARKRNLVTSFGKLWDPLADKIIVTSTLIFLAVYNFSPIWIVIIFVLRDLIVDGSRVVMAQKNIGVEANVWGKMKTLFQTLAIVSVFIVAISYNYPVQLQNDLDNKAYVILSIYGINFILLIALFFSIFSGIIYFKKITPFLQMK